MLANKASYSFVFTKVPDSYLPLLSEGIFPGYRTGLKHDALCAGCDCLSPEVGFETSTIIIIYGIIFMLLQTFCTWFWLRVVVTL